MKRIKLFEDFVAKHSYKIPADKEAFIKIFKTYVDKEKYKITKDTILTSVDIEYEYGRALHLYNLINKTKVDIKSYDDIWKYTSKQMVDEFGHEGFNSEEDAIEFLDEILESDFPYGFKNVPQKVKLYRVLFVKSEKKINKKSLGYHFMPDKDLIDDSFLMSIGGESFDWDETPPYLVEVLVDRDEIEWSHSVSSKSNFPYEFEITMKSKSPKLEIISISLLEI